MKLLAFLKVIIGIYLIICVVFYFFQEKLIFFPTSLDKDHQFNFSENFEDLYFETADGTLIHGLLFRAKDPKGLIFYLHGNAGSLENWGGIASTYTDLDYDIFMLDYRGYGKSGGKISSEKQLYDDNQRVYNELKKTCDEIDIVILGFSIGSGMASKLASDNAPKRLILQAPYYSLPNLISQIFPIFPNFIIKYTFANHEYLKNCNMPVSIIHGDQDEVIPYKSSLKLKAELDSKVDLITLEGAGHNDLMIHPGYRKALKTVLE